MNVIEVLITIALLSSATLAALLSDCLRNYSRHKLASLCHARDQDDLFGEILEKDEPAIVASEWSMLLTLIPGLLLLFHTWVQQIESPTELALTAMCIGMGLFAALLVRLLPRSLSRIIAEPVLYRCWPLLRALLIVARPLLAGVHGVDTLFHRLAGRQDPVPEERADIGGEIQSVVDQGARAGSLELNAGDMIQRVIEMSEEDVQAIMTPRTDMVCISRETPLEEARHILVEEGHSRVPVIGDSPDDVVGFLHAKDLLEHVGGKHGDKTLQAIVRDPYFIPETTSIDSLLERMKLDRQHMAIVLDEYGGVTGLVTLEDVLEEIVGEIEDEFDEEVVTEQIRKINETTLELDARTHIDDLNKMFEYELPEDGDYDTIGGFVFAQLGHVPEPGEEVHWRNLRLVVIEAGSQTINKLRLHVDPSMVASHENS